MTFKPLIRVRDIPGVTNPLWRSLVKSPEADNLGYLTEATVHAWTNTMHRSMKKYPDPKLVIPGHQS